MLHQGTDRGLVRQGNDRTADNRIATFRDWLGSHGYDHLCCAEAITPIHAIWLIGSFIDHMAATPWNSKGDRRSSATLRHFTNAAASFLHQVMTEPFSMYTSVGGKQVQDPYLASRLATFAKWDKRKPKREPYTIDMFRMFHHQVTAMETEDSLAFLGLLPLVFDTQCI